MENTTTMNSDCLTNIYDFINASKAMVLSKKSAADHFPKKVALSGFAQLDQFNRLARFVDTSRLEEVTIDIFVQDAYAARLGEVPPSVKHLTVRSENHSRLAIPPTVEVLILEKCWQSHIDLPNGIKTLVLGEGFGGSIRTFPETLEELTILSWEQPWGFASSTPRRIQNIPDSVRKIEIGAGAPVVVWRWPESVETVVLPENHWGVNVWLDHDHAEFPEGLEVTLKPDVLEAVEEFVEPHEHWYDDDDTWDSMWD